MAMEAVNSGDQAFAVSYVFGERYENDVEMINDKTDAVIRQIQNRLDSKKKIMLTIQLAVEVLFLISFFYVIRQIIISIKFSRQELLMPITRVSDQMVAISNGNLHAAFDMKDVFIRVQFLHVIIIIFSVARYGVCLYCIGESLGTQAQRGTRIKGGEIV